jgi:lipoprotein-anchoring transpeptidase ErfK/SrfK
MQTNEPIRISVRDQRLDFVAPDGSLTSYPVSTSRFGVGFENGSFKTPLGRFRICEKIGAGLPNDTVFVGRIPLGLDDPAPATEDRILSRILWLEGLEEQNANTRERFIYIHGTPHEAQIGRPASHGCIRMKRADLLALFDAVSLGAGVVIEP